MERFSTGEIQEMTNKSPFNPANYDLLLPANRRLSVLNWGTNWEIRRYAILSQVLWAFAERSSSEQDLFALNFNYLDYGDRIDLCTLAFLEAESESESDFFRVDENQISSELVALWKGEASRWLREYGTGILAFTPRSLFESLLEGPLENLFRAEYEFEVHFSGFNARGCFSVNKGTSMGEKLALNFYHLDESCEKEFADTFVGYGYWHTDEYALDLEFEDENETLYRHFSEPEAGAKDLLTVLKFLASKAREDRTVFSVEIGGDRIPNFDSEFIVKRNRIIQDSLFPNFNSSATTPRLNFYWKDL